MNPTRRHSSKREAILSVMRDTKCHPSADWIYAQLKPLYPNLSLGTVYRNLALFRENGEIISVGTVCGQERFDADTQPHVHFVCECCGSVLDVDADPAPLTCELYERLRTQNGLQPRTHALTFFGRCQACAREQEPNK